jgi:predicted nucleotidyltransferase
VINIAIVAEIAEALKDMKNDMIFVGGAVISLYTDDPAADEIRPTQDVDLTLNVLNLGHWEKVQAQLAKLGFHPNPEGHAICSYKYKDILVDIMSMEDGPLGPANKWYSIGAKNLWSAKAKEQEINILSAPCYLATKFEAFNDRGKDYRTSHDIEDIIYILDNRTNIVDEVNESEANIKAFVVEQLQIIIDKDILNEVLMAHIHPLMIEERLTLIEEKIHQIINQSHGI